MDDSKEYICMCHAARELQDGHVFTEGEVFTFIVDKEIREVAVFDGQSELVANEDQFIWLPRQRQLTDLCKKVIHGSLFIEIRGEEVFIYENYEKANISRDGFDTVEKALLSYYMSKKYKKVWKDTYWLDFIEPIYETPTIKEFIDQGVVNVKEPDDLIGMIVETSGILTLNVKEGERGIIYDVYRDYDEPTKFGWSIIFESGAYDGFSVRDRATCNINIVGVSMTAQKYKFISVLHLTNDFRKGKFKFR